MDIGREATGLERRFFELCRVIVTEQGLALYDIEYVPSSHLLRLYIINDETDTAQLDECVRVDKGLTTYIESEDWMPPELRLEVSSPGIFRKLRTVEHFQRAKGREIALVLRSDLSKMDISGSENLPKELSGKKIKCILCDVTDKGIKLTYENFSFGLDFENIKKANLSPNINFK